MFPASITLITLGVDDLERSERFYAALGWEPVERTEGVRFYQLAGQVFGLFGREALAKDQGRPGAALGTGAATLGRNFATEAEVDAAFALALSAGASALKAPSRVFWGGYSGYFADPGRACLGTGGQSVLAAVGGRDADAAVPRRGRLRLQAAARRSGGWARRKAIASASVSKARPVTGMIFESVSIIVPAASGAPAVT